MISLKCKDDKYPIIFKLPNVDYKIDNGDFPKIHIKDEKFIEFLSWITKRFSEHLNIEISHQDFNIFTVQKFFNIQHKTNGEIIFTFSIIQNIDNQNNFKQNSQLLHII